MMAQVLRTVRAGVLMMGAMIACAACTTERASQPGAPLHSKEIDWGLHADINVDTGHKLVGTSKRSRLLFFTVDAPNKFAEGVFVSTQSGLISWLFGDWYDDLKAAAAYDAVYGKADVLVNPQWAIEVQDYLFFSVTKVTVTGYAGTIRSIQNSSDASRSRATPPRTQAFATPPAPVGAPLPAADALASMSSPARTRQDEASSPATLSIRTLAAGDGPTAAAGDLVTYHYTCSVRGGRQIFDSRNAGPARRRIAGSADAPAGLGEGLIGARAGMHRELTIPPGDAYGTAGLPEAGIPSGATLVMDVYIDGVQPAKR